MSQRQIVITINAQGQMNVQGPLPDRILFKGMLAEASRICDEWHQKQQAGAGKVLTPGTFRVPPGNGHGG